MAFDPRVRFPDARVMWFTLASNGVSPWVSRFPFVPTAMHGICAPRHGARRTRRGRTACWRWPRRSRRAGCLRSTAWCCGGWSTSASGCGRSSASGSRSGPRAGRCARWAAASARRGRSITPRRSAPSRRSRKLSRGPGRHCRGERPRPRRGGDPVRRRSQGRPEERHHPPLDTAWHQALGAAGPALRLDLHLRGRLPQGRHRARPWSCPSATPQR